jgi:hypothetical protein
MMFYGILNIRHTAHLILSGMSFLINPIRMSWTFGRRARWVEAIEVSSRSDLCISNAFARFRGILRNILDCCAGFSFLSGHKVVKFQH